MKVCDVSGTGVELKAPGETIAQAIRRIQDEINEKLKQIRALASSKEFVESQQKNEVCK